ncbi:MAG: hypothetical protein RTU92_10105 [Candidatus Thorarchaeota archaeon]
MAISNSLKNSRLLTLSAVFAAMIAVLDMILTPGFYSGIWDSLIFILSPLVGMILGPYAGALAVGIGTFTGHVLIFRDPFELVYMFGAPLGAAMAGFVYDREWRPVLGIYSALLFGYFIYPVSWELPLWGIWDILLGYVMLVLFTVITIRKLWPSDAYGDTNLRVILATVIGLESDILLRVFILVPGQTYWLFYGFDVAVLQIIWLGAGFVTAFKVALAVSAGIIITVPLLLMLNREGLGRDVLSITQDTKELDVQYDDD